MDQVIDAIKPLLEDPGVIKIAHNAKYDVQILAAAGIKMSPVDDTMLMSYVLDGGKHSHGLDDLSVEFCAHEMIGYKDIVGSGKSQIGFDEVAPADALDYAAEDADITRRLHHLFRPRLTSESMASVYERIERPLIPIIAGMETRGIKVDRLILKEMSADFDQRLADLERDIHELAGSEFNVGSPQQLGEVLFDNLGLEGGKKTKTGNWSTAADILEDQLDQLDVDSDEYRVINGVLEWRSLSKLKSTYTDALQDQINDDTGRVHTSYSMAVTATGRLSSSDPNLQNIPIRTEEGRKIRTAFVPADGHKLVSVDYSQVELRLIADIADIPAMKRAFLDGRDIHATTASEMFDVPLDEMTSDIRRKAKAINYGIIYGISAYGLARQLNIPRHEASDYIDTYFDRFPELKTYMERAKEFAREHGYVETEFGRKCYIPQIKARNYARRSYAERQAINAPIQGTAADIMKRAMIKVDDLITREMEGVKMLLQVHDELLFEIPEDMVKDVTPKIVEVMEGVYNMSVPLIADHGAGDNWDQAH
jgi:DNA polymerase-1